MLEVLDFVRNEFDLARFSYDEDTSTYYKDENAEEKFKRFNELRNDIVQKQYNVRADFFEIGKYLFEIRRDKLYHSVKQLYCNSIYGYSNFYKFCDEVLGFKKTTVCNLLNVYESFICDKSLSVVSSVNFSYSQLVALLDIDDKYKPRISVQTSVRDIKRLAEYYKENTPGKSVESDLKDYVKWKNDKNARKNAKKNSITFVPSKVGVVIDIDDDADANDVVTPSVNPVLREDQIINGLLRQLDLLKNHNLVWSKLVDVVSDALRTKTPRKVAKSSDLTTANIRIIELQKLLSEKNGQVSALCQPATGKLDLKNDKDRENFLNHYEDWGLWLSVPDVSRKYYRYDFINGSSVVVEFGYERWTYGDKKYHPLIRYSLLEDDKTIVDMCGSGGKTAIIKYMSAHKIEI